MEMADLWALIFKLMLGETLFVEHTDLGAACSVLSSETRKSWLIIEEPCVHASHARYRQIARLRVEASLLRKFMYATARRFRTAEGKKSCAVLL